MSKLYTDRKSWDEYFLDIARIVSTRSTCRRRKVGCVIVHSKRILSTGYNGAGQSEEHCLDVGCSLDQGRCIRAIHAEANAVREVYNRLVEIGYESEQNLRSGKALTDITAYVTVKPCDECQALLNKHGIDVIYAEEYR